MVGTKTWGPPLTISTDALSLQSGRARTCSPLSPEALAWWTRPTVIRCVGTEPAMQQSMTLDSEGRLYIDVAILATRCVRGLPQRRPVQTKHVEGSTQRRCASQSRETRQYCTIHNAHHRWAGRQPTWIELGGYAKASQPNISADIHTRREIHEGSQETATCSIRKTLTCSDVWYAYRSLSECWWNHGIRKCFWRNYSGK